MLGHGAIKLRLIAGLLRERLWFYPAAISIFGLFIAYQLYRYTSNGSVRRIASSFLRTTRTRPCRKPQFRQAPGIQFQPVFAVWVPVRVETKNGPRGPSLLVSWRREGDSNPR
ncbi:MAG: DUF2127 domain-containing protein [Trinickia sp.]|uniref:DUF2127 domain-containing protein n=1 Tax=Trinickia sp. TaxID=2571163 RepID=UPI003F8141A9